MRGTFPKHTVHDASTPLHLAFSCYVVDAAGRVLLTRRAATKRTWPSTWTNACCGHPRIDESLRQAVERHLRTELDVAPTAISLALGDFVYRAAMDNGTSEHEWCPVVVARIDTDVNPNPDEVESIEWTAWSSLVERARNRPGTLSPWCVLQVERLAQASTSLADLLDADDPADALLDTRPGTGRAAGPSVDGTLAPIRQRVDSYLSSFLEDRRGDVPEADDAMCVLQSAIAGLAEAGGKRLRPAFVAAGFEAAGGDVNSAPIQAAAAVEMLHTFALIHDDVMDRSARRRGAPTVQHVMAGHLPRTDGADWFGISAAILAGDLAFVWADQMFDRLEDLFPDTCRRAARFRFDQLRTEVIAGQYLDLRMGTEPVATETDALRVALLKSSALHRESAAADRCCTRRRRRPTECTTREVRRRRRTRLPAPRRHPRAVRKHGDHRQATDRRPPRRQTHRAHARAHSPSRPPETATSSNRLWDAQPSTSIMPHGVAASWPPPAPWPRSRRRSTSNSRALPISQQCSRRTRTNASRRWPTSPPDATTDDSPIPVAGAAQALTAAGLRQKDREGRWARSGFPPPVARFHTSRNWAPAGHEVRPDAVQRGTRTSTTPRHRADGRGERLRLRVHLRSFPSVARRAGALAVRVDDVGRPG